MFNLQELIRPNIKNLSPYSSARNEYKGKEGVFLDANENSFGSAIGKNMNRYPDPFQIALKEKIGRLKGINPQQIFLGNGSDEAIDILFRAFCNPGKDNVIIVPPTYGMYEVSAVINDIKCIKVNLTEEYQLDVTAMLDAVNGNTKLIFLCCPNNPTGTALKGNDIKTILSGFKGIVVLDEAYIDFASYKSLIPDLNNYPNLVILQTFSKAWGLASLRIGMAFASQEIIAVFNKIKPPYNISGKTQELALQALDNEKQVNIWISEINKEKESLVTALNDLDCILKIYPSSANFILVKTKDAKAIYDCLVSEKIIVRNRSNITLCEGCLRITIGTADENKRLLNALKNIDL